MSSKNEEKKKIPLGPAAGKTALYAVSLILFMICGIWIPFRNFNLILQRLGPTGELPAGSQNAYELTSILFNYQGLVIVIFCVLIIYFWWSSTWADSMSKKASRFLLWCIPAGLYILMLWIINCLMIPVRVVRDVISQGFM